MESDTEEAFLTTWRDDWLQQTKSQLKAQGLWKVTKSPTIQSSAPWELMKQEMRAKAYIWCRAEDWMRPSMVNCNTAHQLWVAICEAPCNSVPSSTPVEITISPPSPPVQAEVTDPQTLQEGELKVSDSEDSQNFGRDPVLRRVDDYEAWKVTMECKLKEMGLFYLTTEEEEDLSNDV
jgi:hypothetical protein